MHNCGPNARLTSRRYRTGTLIAISFVVLVACSVPVFGTRFLNDMEFYSLFANKLLSGRVLYRDALDTKPPLVFLHYALLFKIFGSNNVVAVPAESRNTITTNSFG